ncbi:MAG: hypothetical protein R3C10_26020 [Pirellulales bacterium]
MSEPTASTAVTGPIRPQNNGEWGGTDRRKRSLAEPLSVALLSVCCLLVTGCGGVRGISLTDWARNGFKVGPEYRRPAVEVAPQWIDFNNPKVISENAGVDASDWWQSLGDARLNELVQVAYRDNLPLRESRFAGA